MSDGKIIELEKDMAVLKSTMPLFIEEMRAATKANMESSIAMTALTGEIRVVNTIAVELKSTVGKINERVYTLESKSAVRDSSGEKWRWVERGIWLSLVGAVAKILLK